MTNTMRRDGVINPNASDVLRKVLLRTPVPVPKRSDEELLNDAAQTVLHYMDSNARAKAADLSGCAIVAEIQQRLAQTKVPCPTHEDHITLLRNCVNAMEMQMGRESGQLHINQPTALKIWQKALQSAKAAIAQYDERADDVVIDLDVESWKAIKQAIQESPRFQDMYQAGGCFTDACSNVISWLNESPEPELEHESTGPGR